MATEPPARALPPLVEAVLLDAGGVLLDLDFAFIRRVARAHQADVPEYRLSEAEARSRFEVNQALRAGHATGSWRDFFHLVLGRAGVPAAEHDSIIDTLWEAHQRHGLWTIAAPRGPETVAELRERGLRLAVVSNAEGQVGRDLDTAGYVGAFEAIIDSHVVGVRKPDPAIFHIALERLKVTAERAVYVGDMPELDAAGAQAANLFPILLDRHGFYAELDILRIRAIEQLLPLLS